MSSVEQLHAFLNKYFERFTTVEVRPGMIEVRLPKGEATPGAYYAWRNVNDLMHVGVVCRISKLPWWSNWFTKRKHVPMKEIT